MIRKTIFVMAVLAFFLTAAWMGTALLLPASYKTFRVPDSSMQPAFQTDQRVVVDRKAYQNAGPQRGDIIVFELTAKGRTRLHCKRVTGLPGETLEIRDGKLFIDGQETEVPGRPDIPVNAVGVAGSDQTKAVLIPQGAYYVLGDNPARSFDSRYFGPVFLTEVYGKVITNYRGKPRLQKIVRLIKTSWIS